jgi:3-oxoadipate enol-lactonase
VPIAQINDVNIWYESSGSGEPIVQVHGSIIGHVNFAPVTPLLAREFRVVDFDMRGFGYSDKPLEQYTMETWADDLAVLLDELELERAHVHGTSMGGLVAVQFAAKYPERTGGLILDCTLARYDTAAAINKRVWKALIQAYGWTEPFWDLLTVQAFSRNFIESDRFDKGLALLKRSSIADTPPEVFLAISHAVETADSVPLLPLISAPTLIMIGDQDILTPYELGPKGAGARALQEQIPNAQLAMLAGCGHINLFEQPDESAHIISSFLRSLTAKKAPTKGA